MSRSHRSNYSTLFTDNGTSRLVLYLVKIVRSFKEERSKFRRGEGKRSPLAPRLKVRISTQNRQELEVLLR